MCGIAGILSFQSRINQQSVTKMLDSIRHRGPDDRGLWQSQSGTVVLGHCRLSILDLTKSGHQPMLSTDGNTILVFNGEIYNYRELRKRFFPGDDSFSSSGDTEVLLRLWERMGEDCLQYLRGMFAFAVWNEQTKELTLARDPCGIKPLYYAQTDDAFIFGSELKAFKALDSKWPVDFQAMGLFLKWGSIPAPKTAYRGINALPAGSTICLKGKHRVSEPKSFWSYHDVLVEADERQPTIHTRVEAVEWVREKTLESVRAHLVSDEPVGAFLSGGIDSSAVVSLMRRAGQQNIGTFCIGFEDDELNESHHAQAVAHTFGTQHVCRVLTKDYFLASVDHFFESMDQPTLDGLNTFIVSELAHDEGYKVVTSGIGGDEVFGGYRRDFLQVPKLHRRLNWGGSLARKLLKHSVRAGGRFGLLPPHWARVEHYLAGEPSLSRCLDMGRGLFAANEVKSIFQNESMGEIAAGHYADAYLPGLDPSFSDRDAASCFLLSRYLQPQLLRDSDNFSMNFSLELRTPLVDAVLYESLAAIRNQEWFFDGEIGKSLFVDAVGDLPLSITHRRKRGFTPPFKNWLQETEFTLDSGYLDEGYFHSVVADYRRGTIPWSRIWMLVVLDRFLLKQLY